ncbi:2-C-methyl-D-erythritol 2,4-cyclodiphosphate synthase [Aquisalimonas asiatica]|uniref:2-C-methyl-D-erythritol 2,4-cyclodiphosphate synthase n=1 Tax=Aquisalimonas asiatica TaxID=406100 RepID=A0A1H8QIU8_9GAMM|nr:2-C-methyl-D-erythritol 2,4-cyclodiphosphate synthase [Aquisalimonas asiatica]SEO53946.1 2-C-methyl-D-erythritol 2,4-cyclodiphosphate synthase [Aquisalimonas asiatica]
MLRIGQGFDVHRFQPEGKLIVGGVEIPYHLGIAAHSDGDVLLHAVTDALLGALADGDIGQHFPDSDPQWQGADSVALLKHVHERVATAGYRVNNIDSTVIAQAPKMAPHIPAMRRVLATSLGVDESVVSVKATTTEQLGPFGRGEGIAAQAVVLLISDD